MRRGIRTSLWQPELVVSFLLRKDSVLAQFSLTNPRPTTRRKKNENTSLKDQDRKACLYELLNGPAWPILRLLCVPDSGEQAPLLPVMPSTTFPRFLALTLSIRNQEEACLPAGRQGVIRAIRQQSIPTHPNEPRRIRRTRIAFINARK
jgi:hypothetical protein